MYDSMASTVAIKNISISQLQNPLYVGEVTQTHDQDKADSKLIQDLKNEIKELKRTVRELQYKSSENYTKPVEKTACKHRDLKAIHQQDMQIERDKFGNATDCRSFYRMVAISCKKCGYHIQCKHICVMYGCGKPVECGIERCKDCFEKR